MSLAAGCSAAILIGAAFSFEILSLTTGAGEGLAGCEAGNLRSIFGELATLTRTEDVCDEMVVLLLFCTVTDLVAASKR